MKAAVYTEYGSPDVLNYKDVPTPTPKEDELLIKIYATPVNIGDLMARKFNTFTPASFSMPTPLWLPARLAIGWNKPRRHILGSEFAGVVEAVGSAVTRFKKGDEVFGFRSMNFGANAEYMVMPEDGLVTGKPENMTFEEAASVPGGALTALNLLRKVDIQRGQKVLINGASGGIGSFALQLAKHYGAEVTGVCATPRMGMVKALGADHVIDYTKEDFTTNGETYDLIMDIQGKALFSRCKRSLKPNGRLLYVSFKMKHLGQMLLTSITGGKRVVCALSSETLADLNLIKELAESRTIKAVVDRCFPLEQAADAHRYMENGQRKGVVVITVAV